MMALALLVAIWGSASAAEQPKPVLPVSPVVVQILGRACSMLTQAQTFSYHADIDFDTVLPSDVKLQFAASMDVGLQHPDRLVVSYKSDLGLKRVWFNGKTVTVLDGTHMTYATSAAPASIDETLEEFARESNMSVPLEGFNFSDPCERMRGRFIQGTYVGVGDVDGTACDHVAFLLEDATGQVWVDRGKRPLFHKVVITYTSLPMAPQFSAVLSRWNFDPKFPAEFFEPQIPKNAVQVEFLKIKEAGK
jgi:hypothetical protein